MDLDILTQMEIDNIEQEKEQFTVDGPHGSAVAKKLRIGTPAYFQHIAGCLAEKLG